MIIKVPRWKQKPRFDEIAELQRLLGGSRQPGINLAIVSERAERAEIGEDAFISLIKDAEKTPYN